MKSFRKRHRHTIVVDIGRGSIKMAAAETAGEARRFRNISKVAVPQEDVLEEDGLAKVVEQLRAEVLKNGWNGAPAACLLSQRSTSTHTYLLPPMPDEEIRQAIELKLRDTLHFDVDEAVFDFRCNPDSANAENPRMMVQVVVARKDALLRNLSVIRQAGLHPTSVSAASESLANLTCLSSLEHQDEASIHIDLGTDSTVINLFDGHVLRFSREIDVTGDSFAEALTRPILTTNQDVVRLTLNQAREILLLTGFPRKDTGATLPHGVCVADIMPLAAPVAQKLTTEIRRSIEYLNGLLDRTGKVEVVLSGPAGSMPNLSKVLEENLHHPVSFVDPVQHAMDHWRLAICDENPPPAAEFSAVLGFSLGHHVPLNLLSQEEAANEARQRATRDQRVRATGAVALLTCLAMVALPLNQSYVKANKQAESTSLTLDGQIMKQSAAVTQWAAFQEKTTKVALARGPIADWTGVMKEITTLLPDSVQITSLESDRKDGALTMHLEARVYPNMNASRATLTQLSQALNDSPFFDKVRVIQASVPLQGAKGKFEATFEVITPPIQTEVLPS